MNIILFDDPEVKSRLLPFTFTRPVADIRIGILTIREKWEHHFNIKASSLTEDYLQKKYPLTKRDENLLINGTLIPNSELVGEINRLEQGQVLVKEGKVLAALLSESKVTRLNGKPLSFENIQTDAVEYGKSVFTVNRREDIFLSNGRAIEEDYILLGSGRKSTPISQTNTLIGDRLFVEEGVKMECVTINTTTGPVYIGKNAEIMEGTVIRGPFALCDNGVVKLAAKIYGPTTIGPFCKVGGEVNNCILFGYSNKGHDGFMGNSVIGEWCNIGADTNTSNLKNNYSEIKVWDYQTGKLQDSGLQFCGLMMGDHSKCGINTMFNTGTVVGVSTNVFGGDFPPKFIPSFSWGGSSFLRGMYIKKAEETAQFMMERRGIEFDEIEKEIFDSIYQLTEKYRKFR